MNDVLRATLKRALAENRPANVALMQAIIAAESREALDRAIEVLRTDPEGDAVAQQRLAAVASLWRERPGAWDLVRTIAAAANHVAPKTSADATMARWSRSFDAASAASPDAGGALYTLGDPDLLTRATREVVDKLGAWGLLGGDRDGLEIGCGSGRFLEALAPRLHSIVGIDISAGMLAEARRRCQGLDNVRLEPSTGQDLAAFADRSFDLVLAADVFPYLVDAGIAAVATHFHEAARVLRPGGALMVFNFSYRGDHALDRAEAERHAARSGLAVIRIASGDFELWDGTSFQFAKRSDPPPRALV